MRVAATVPASTTWTMGHRSAPAPNPSSGDPANEGGALRSQDLRTIGDAVSLDGTVIRIDPNTGAALPSNPLFGDGDAKARRIVAQGLRNPFRFTIRPSTNEVWIGDVGWNNWEEINRIPNPTDQLVENFGWPCFEGNARQSGYDSANRPICENLYGEPTAQSGLTSPYYTYNHSAAVVAGEACPTGSSSISGLAFYPQAGGQYPTAYNGALFFTDYSRDCIWAMRVGENGLPNPSDIVTIKTNPGSPREGPVHLVSGPGGDIYYVGLDDQRLHRISYNSGNQPPTAAIQAVPAAGASPLTVNFSAAGSSDPEGQSLSYAWDLDGDGAFDDATSVAPQFTYSVCHAHVDYGACARQRWSRPHRCRVDGCLSEQHRRRRRSLRRQARRLRGRLAIRLRSQVVQTTASRAPFRRPPCAGRSSCTTARRTATNTASPSTLALPADPSSRRTTNTRHGSSCA